jgi:glycosyltransferase involved in cell wall biosynthesis
MACGCAVVTARLPALEEAVIEGKTGLCFHPDDPEDLARTIDGLIANPNGRRELGAAARQWVCEHRTWEGLVERYRGIYQELGAFSTARRAVGP